MAREKVYRSEWPSYSRFQTLLDQYGVSAFAVSKETGITSSTFSDWKNGRSYPKEMKLKKIALFFDVPMSYFQDGVLLDDGKTAFKIQEIRPLIREIVKEEVRNYMREAFK